MNTDFLSHLEQQGIIWLDGALATELERRGADLADPLWSSKVLLEQPELIRQVHYDYFVAGADVATTASYQATFEGFAKRGISREQATDLLRLSVQLAREAREQFWAEQAESALRPLGVAASIGPYGAYLADGSEYRGDYGLSMRQLMDFHRPRMAVLAESGADLLACETIPTLLEAEALIQLLAEFPEQSAWLSFSCGNESQLWHGESFADAVALANQSPQVVAVGINCTAPRLIEPLLRSVGDIARKPLLVYPNSGEQWDAAQRCWLPGTGTTDWTEPVRAWIAAGARLIGGCCRTTPDDIRTMRHAVANLPEQSRNPSRPSYDIL
jgi:homocysteine S-methyltransferase